MAEGFYLAKELKDEKLKEQRLARLEDIENACYEQAAQIVSAGFRFAEVTHDQADPPESWIAEFGPQGARQMLALAKAMWLPQSVAPAGFKLAAQYMAGVQRGRALRMKVVQNNLNVKIALPAPTTPQNPGPTVYEVRDLET